MKRTYNSTLDQQGDEVLDFSCCYEFDRLNLFCCPRKIHLWDRYPRADILLFFVIKWNDYRSFVRRIALMVVLGHLSGAHAQAL